MAPTLYMMDYSPPVRAVRLTASILGLDLELKKVNLMNQEQHSEDYLKLNPAHTIPTLVDGEVVICDSHAINTYLIGKYSDDKTAFLYPQDLAKRALVDERLFLDGISVFVPLKSIVKGKFLGKFDKIPQDNLEEVKGTYASLENFLGDNQWMTGDSFNLADVALYTTLLSINVLVPIEESKFPKLKGWLERAQSLPEFSVDAQWQAEFKSFMTMLF